MAITKQRKQDILKKITDIVAKSKSVVFINFHGLKVLSINEIRQGLRAHGIGYYVLKKTLLKRALADHKIMGDIPHLDGEIGVVYGEDMVGPAKQIAAFAKKLKENLKLMGGVMEGRFLSREEVTMLSAVPSREELLGQLVSVLAGPARGFVTVLSGVPRGFVVALDQISQKK